MMTDKLPQITLSQVATELRDTLKKAPRVPVSSTLARWLIRAATKLFLRDRPHEGIRLEKHVTKEGVHLRVYTPNTQTSRAALLWIHGGGLVIGNAAQDDGFCAETARALGMIVVSTEYRLAPEFPFPAALDDCYAAWTWLQDSSSQLNIDENRIAIGGQSAGGGLAASLVQRIHDTREVQPAAQWLFCPMLDDRTAASRKLDDMKHWVWDNQQNRVGWRAYLGTEPGSDTMPDYAVPARRRNLAGLPPTWIGVGDIDLFFDEDKIYADRLTAVDVDCTFDSVPAAPHAFETFAPNIDLARNYLLRARAWLRQKLITH
jgi:acetyl esterase/lipase